MPAVFPYQVVVTPAVIDPLGHVNNIEYLRWMQEAAIEHSRQQGWSAADYQKLGVQWVVASHRIRYHYPARKEDEVIVWTWIADFRRVRSLRRYAIVRNRDQRLLAEGETEWVLVRAADGRPIKVPDAIRASFQIVSEPPIEIEDFKGGS